MPRLLGKTSLSINLSSRTTTEIAGAWLIACILSGASPHASAQVMRCTDTKTGEVTYTNGRCIDRETATQVQPAQSAQEIAQERDAAAKARQQSQAQMARDDAQRRQREDAERKEREAAARAQAGAGSNLENSPACRQARVQRHSGGGRPRCFHLGRAQPGGPGTDGDELPGCHGLSAVAADPCAATQCHQPPAMGLWSDPPAPGAPPATAARKIVNCNVFRCYDNRGGVHPIP